MVIDHRSSRALGVCPHLRGRCLMARDRHDRDNPVGKVDDTAAMPNVKLCLLGGFDLRCDGLEVAAPMSAQRVLAFAALSASGAQRTFAAGTLWPDATEERA